jgi:peptidoglycan pentaglycine glycine transferase (the first glycine)
MTLTVRTITQKSEWNRTLATFDTAHILQTWEWGDFKQSTTGWTPLRWQFEQEGQPVAMMSLGVRSMAGFKVMYAPKGFVAHWQDQPVVNEVLDYLQAYARKNPTVWLKLDPDIVQATGMPHEEDDTPNAIGTAWRSQMQTRNWRFSADQVQFRNSICVDLTPNEETILANMSQNTRRKVRTGEKKGVSVRTASVNDLDTLYQLYQVTGERDDFLIRPFSYYQQAWRDFMQAGLAHALIAEYEGQAIAHVILFHFGRKCWYFYGASSNIARETMPNYALQWEAMRWAKSQGYSIYDMWGAPNDFVETDSMWGVFEFKRGFRGVITRHVGAWDYAPYPPLYWAYTQAIPKVRGWLKR